MYSVLSGEHSKKITYALCGDDGKKDTPVPMPNTAVKLLSADGSWTFGPVRVGRRHASVLCYSAIAQLVERMTVNHDVVGSSPTCGVIRLVWRVVRAGRRSTIGNRVGE